MLESVFVILFCMGFVTMILGLFDEWDTLLSLIMSIISILFFIGAWAGTVYIEVPNDTFYSELGLGWICFGLIIVNAIGVIISSIQVNMKLRRKV